MKHTTEVKLANRGDVILVQRGFMEPEEVRSTVVKDALVDTGASRLSLPKSLIKQLGLTPVGKTKAMTANGIVDRTLYSEVEFTILNRTESIKVTDLPDDAPVLVGHMVIELLDLCLDIKQGLIYNPAHDGAWIEDQFTILVKKTEGD